MDLPFTEAAFFEVFRRYNEVVWPLQLAFYALSFLLVFLTSRDSAIASRWISGILAFLWGWMGVVYHWGFFAAINPAAKLFGGIFLLQAAALFFAGVSGRLSYRLRRDRYNLAGWLLIVYALVVYPLLGALAGHSFPRGATFGLPCPTTIFTFGLLLWSDRHVPLWVVGIPAAWSIVGVSAAVQLSVAEDYGLLISAALAITLIVERNRKLRDEAVSAVATAA